MAKPRLQGQTPLAFELRGLLYLEYPGLKQAGTCFAEPPCFNPLAESLYRIGLLTTVTRTM